VQASRIAARAHKAIEEATREIEQQLAYGRANDSVLRPRREPSGGTADGILRAEVVDRSWGDAAADADRRVADARPPLRTQPHGAHGFGDGILAGGDGAGSALIEAAHALEVQLCDAGVDVEVARSIVGTVIAHRRPFSASSDLRELARDLVAELMRVEPGWAPVGRTHRIAVVGPSGAGKSSVVAKLAEGWRRMAGFDVGVISIQPRNDDGTPPDRSGDPLLRVRDLDVRFVADAEQMTVVLERLSQCDVVLIDTPSSAYLDRASFAQVGACLAAAGVDEVHAVVPLATRVREAESVVEHFRPLGVNRLVVTKLDESRYAGQLLNFGFRFGMPIPFVTDGQRVPEDIRVASAREIAALIVPHTSQEM
jgi:flagellar biosynthesis protein FlhF